MRPFEEKPIGRIASREMSKCIDIVVEEPFN
jgi:hypothetical protein